MNLLFHLAVVFLLGWGEVGADSSERELTPRIINGKDAPEDRYPYMVSLQASSRSSHFCGGTLIAPDIVLSAAHCQLPKTEFFVRTNPFTLENPLERSESFRVADVVIHPDSNVERFLDKDFMIIKLDGQSSQPLVRLNQDPDFPVSGQQLKSMGWGTLTFGGGIPDTLQHTVRDYAYIDTFECAESAVNLEQGIVGEVSEANLCIRATKTGTCNGDSGGPSIVAGDNPEEDIQVGITSFGISGCVVYPVVHARVSFGYSWIREQVCILSSAPPDTFLCDEFSQPSFAPSIQPKPSASPAPTMTTIPITIRFNFDARPQETGWNIQDALGNKVYDLPPESYRGRRTESLILTIQLERGQPYLFNLLDSQGDGMCCNSGTGSVFVFQGSEENYDKVIIYFAGEFGSTDSVVFTSGTTDFVSFDAPTATPSASPAPSIEPTSTAVPTGQLNDVTLFIDPGTYPQDVGWRISLGSRVVQERPSGWYDALTDSVVERFSLQVGVEYEFAFFDASGNGLRAGSGFAVVYLGMEVDEDKVLLYDDGEFNDTRLQKFTVSQDATISVTPSPTMVPSVATLSPTGTKYIVNENQSVITVVFQLDIFPEEIRWYLVRSDGRVVFSAGPYESTTSGNLISETVVVEKDSFHTLEIIDSFGDGILFGGYAAVFLSDRIADNRILLVIDGDSIRFFEEGVFVPNKDFIRPDLILPDFNPFPSRSPDASLAPSNSLTSDVLITMVLKLDNFPGETAWLLRGNDNTIIFSGGPYDILSGLVRETVAVKESATYELLLRDSFGDGIFSGSIIVYLGDGSNTADDRALLFLDGGFRRFISGKFVADDAGILPDFALASFAPTSLFAPLPFSPAPSVTPTTRAPSISPAPSRTKVDVTVRLSFDVEAAQVQWIVYTWPELDIAHVIPPFTYTADQSLATVDETILLDLAGSYVIYVFDGGDDGVCCQKGKGEGVSIFLGATAGDNSNLLASIPGNFGPLAMRRFTVATEGVLEPGTFPTSSPTITNAPTIPKVDVLIEIYMVNSARNIKWLVATESEQLYSSEFGSYVNAFKIESTIMSLELGDSYFVQVFNQFGGNFFEGQVAVYLGSERNDKVLYRSRTAFDTFSVGGTFLVSEAGILLPTMAPVAPSPTKSAVPSRFPSASPYDPSPLPSPLPSSYPSLHPSSYPSPYPSSYPSPHPSPYPSPHPYLYTTTSPPTVLPTTPLPTPPRTTPEPRPPPFSRRPPQFY